VNQVIDASLTIAIVTAFDEMPKLPEGPATVGVGKLERPKKVIGLLKVGPDGEDLVNQIFDADDTKLAQMLFDERIVGYGNALLVDFDVTSLVDKVADRLEIRFTICNIWHNQLEHLLSCFGQPNKHSIVYLEETHELQNLAWLRRDFVDTLDADDESQLRLSGNIVIPGGLGLTTQTDLIPLRGTIFLDILFGALKDGFARLLGSLALLKQEGGPFFTICS